MKFVKIIQCYIMLFNFIQSCPYPGTGRPRERPARLAPDRLPGDRRGVARAELGAFAGRARSGRVGSHDELYFFRGVPREEFPMT